MIKKCSVCGHTGELTWRDGKYHCAVCDSEVSEKEPQVQLRNDAATYNAVCPICKNKENNLFDGSKYRCALCGTPFDLPKVVQTQSYKQFSYVNDNDAQKVKELKKQKNRNLVLGILFIWLFWPVSIYFFYKFNQIGKELKALGY